MQPQQSSAPCRGILLLQGMWGTLAVAVSCSAASMPHGILNVCKMMKMLSSPAGAADISAPPLSRLAIPLCRRWSAPRSCKDALVCLHASACLKRHSLVSI